MVIRHSIKELLAKSMVTRPTKCIVVKEKYPLDIKKKIVLHTKVTNLVAFVRNDSLHNNYMIFYL